MLKNEEKMNAMILALALTQCIFSRKMATLQNHEKKPMNYFISPLYQIYVRHPSIYLTTYVCMSFSFEKCLF